MAERIEAPAYPIIYVRGYAATMQEVEDTAAAPYVCFNPGSTLLRQDYTKRPRKFIFESPLLRLIKDHQYPYAYRQGSDEFGPGGSVARIILGFRGHEKVSCWLDGTGRRVARPARRAAAGRSLAPVPTFSGPAVRAPVSREDTQ